MNNQAFQQTTRWLLTGQGLKKPRAYFDEGTARRTATRVEQASNASVHVQKQVYVGGTWQDEGAADREWPVRVSVEGPSGAFVYEFIATSRQAAEDAAADLSRGFGLRPQVLSADGRTLALLRSSGFERAA